MAGQRGALHGVPPRRRWHGCVFREPEVQRASLEKLAAGRRVAGGRGEVAILDRPCQRAPAQAHVGCGPVPCHRPHGKLNLTRP